MNEVMNVRHIGKHLLGHDAHGLAAIHQNAGVGNASRTAR
jgi:hypothetical protein